MSAKKRTGVLFLTVILIFSRVSHSNESSLKISVAVTKEILSIYKNWTATQPCWKVSEFPGKHSNRGAAELIILCKALHLAGTSFEFNFIPTQNYTKAMRLVRQKKAHLNGESVWRSQADLELFYSSPATLRAGEFEKGIYTLKNHPMMDQVRSIKDLKNYRGTTLSSWYQDWHLLRQLTDRLIKARSSLAIHDIINKNRADFTLAEFNRDMRLNLNGVTLYPVPNIKVEIKESRHFIVRRGMENSAEIIAAISKGLTQMRQLKMIKSTYVKTGFINPDVLKWKSLNPYSNR